MAGQIIGRGRLYFERFAAGTTTPENGELYFGNTPELTLNQSAETIEHYSSEGGLKELDASVDLSITSGGSRSIWKTSRCGTRVSTRTKPSSRRSIRPTRSRT
jgi:hypothetical protein